MPRWIKLKIDMVIGILSNIFIIQSLISFWEPFFTVTAENLFTGDNRFFCLRLGEGEEELMGDLGDLGERDLFSLLPWTVLLMMMLPKLSSYKILGYLVMIRGFSRLER